MGGIFRSPRAATPPPPPPPPPQTEDKSVEQANRAAEAERRRAESGRASTLLTGADGVTDQAELGRKLLLGA